LDLLVLEAYVPYSPAIFYSFSFNPNPKWTSFHPEAVEIATYLQGTIDKFGIQSNIQLDTDVAGARWLEDKQEWEITTRRLHHGAGDLGGPKMQQMIKEKGESSIVVKQEVIRCKVFVPCAGSLVDANDFPASIPGIEHFKGKVFHSALWDPEIVLKDKNVVVLGAGCSAAQLVPRLSQDPWNAKSVTQLMREPSWVAPAITVS
jgi:cation diffusion facilitator CzcD-associated flavoprotein CzcO